MIDLNEAFNHAARMSDPVKAAKERDREFLQRMVRLVVRDMIAEGVRKGIEAIYDERLGKVIYPGSK